MKFRTVDSAQRWGKKGWALYYAIAADYERLFEKQLEHDLETLRDPQLPRYAQSRQDALARIKLVKSTPDGRALVASVKRRIGYVPRFPNRGSPPIDSGRPPKDPLIPRRSATVS